MERDVKNLENAKGKGAVYVFVNMKTGVIVASSKHTPETVPAIAYIDKKFMKENSIELMSVEEYEWFTDKNRHVNVVTGADLADKVGWTNRGFVVDGKKMPFQEKEK